MCDHTNLAIMDNRSPQSKPGNQAEHFGGILFYYSDIAQLLPVLNHVLFMGENSTQQWSVHGRYMFKNFDSY